MKKRLKKILGNVLSPEELIFIPNSYDIVGNIAIMNLDDKFSKNVSLIAKTIMNIHKNVSTVMIQKSPVRGECRLRELKIVIHF